MIVLLFRLLQLGLELLYLVYEMSRLYERFAEATSVKYWEPTEDKTVRAWRSASRTHL